MYEVSLHDIFVATGFAEPLLLRWCCRGRASCCTRLPSPMSDSIRDSLPTRNCQVLPPVSFLESSKGFDFCGY